MIIIAYFAGILTIFSPCILPVLPFVFAKSDQPFLKSGLPLLLGMAITFAAVTTLAVIGSEWVVQANQFGRYLALIMLALFALTLLIPRFATWLARPFVAMGNKINQSASSCNQSKSSIYSSILLGIATGLLWAPCAGPILGIILTTASLNGASINTSLLLFAYAAGAATTLALALLVGGRIFNTMKKALGTSEWIRRLIGTLMLAGVVAIAFGLDTGLLTKLSSASTTELETKLLNRLPNTNIPKSTVLNSETESILKLPVEREMPSLSGATQWINSPPLSKEELKGKVVLVDFWTYSCINCLRSLPYVNQWAEKYKDKGLVVIGVHTPEFAFEKNADNVKQAVKDLKISYPVAMDNNYAIWGVFNNSYWPAHYFIDAKGRIRYHHFGEGEYDLSEKVIRSLLIEAGQKLDDEPASTLVKPSNGTQMAPNFLEVQSPETYIGYQKAQSFASVEPLLPNKIQTFTAPAKLDLNQWALSGTWQINDENAVLKQAGGRILFNFHARDLHLVLGPDASGKPIRFKVLIDGKAPGPNHGTDIDANGNGVVTENRLYQLVRQSGEVGTHTFEIQFLDAGVEAYAFTFG